MDRLVQRNVLAMSGRAVEASGDVDVLLLDKTGTITLGNRQATEFIPAPGVDERELAEVAQLASLADETPEGRSIVVLAKEKFDVRERVLGEHEFVPFSATTRMSGVNLNGTMIRKGAADAVKAFIAENGGRAPAEIDTAVQHVAEQGGTPLVVARDNFALGVVHLKDIVKGGMNERFDELRAHGHPHGDDHRRQPRHRRRDRAGGGRRRLPRRGDAGGEARADQGRAGRRAAWSR